MMTYESEEVDGEAWTPYEDWTPEKDFGMEPPSWVPPVALDADGDDARPVIAHILAALGYWGLAW